MLKTKDIAFICDDNYCMPTAVCIQSIIDCYTCSEILNIHVCTLSLTRHNMERLISLSTSVIKVSIDVFHKQDFESKMRSVSQKTHVTPTSLIKFELPNFFSKLDKLLYLDSDIIIKADISSLLNKDINDCYLAASYEFWEYLNIRRYSFKRSLSKFYFNSGVMLLNLQKMREDRITEKLWYYKTNKAKTKLMDQESLNAVCGINSISLSIKWNFNPIFLDNKFLSDINRLYKESYSSVNELESDVRIIHYVGAMDKPWIYEDARLRHYWDSNFSKTPFVSHLKLKKAQPVKQTLISSLRSKIKEHGLTGTICYLVYCIESSIKTKF